MEKFNQKQTIENIGKYLLSFEKKTAEEQYKPFFTIYAKKRNIFNPFRFILGEYKFNYFEKNKQPKSYINAFELFTDYINLDVKDITINENKL